MKYINQIKELREKIPIGLKDAKVILEKNDGNVELAISQYKTRLIKKFREATGTDTKTAEELVAETNYSLIDAIKKLELSKLSETEKALRAKGSNEQKVSFISHAIIYFNFDYDCFDFKEEQLAKLNVHQKSVFLIEVWLDYLDYEGFWSALYHNFFEEAMNVLDSILQMKQMANEIKNAKKIAENYRKNHQSGAGNYSAYQEALEQNEKYAKTKQLLEKKQEQVYETIIKYVQKHLIAFP